MLGSGLVRREIKTVRRYRDLRLTIACLSETPQMRKALHFFFSRSDVRYMDR
jgi:hypothetical protein